MDVSIIIASFNTREYLADCLRSVVNSNGAERFEVFVVDNGSTDGSAEMVRREYPGVAVISNEENIGFARANNRALVESRGRYILLLNPDAEVRSSTLSEMVELMDSRPDVGLSGVKLIRGDGRMDEACRRGFPTLTAAFAKLTRLDRLFPNSRLLSRYNLRYRDPDGEYEVDAVVGAFMFFRRSVLEEVGMLDESYFMFGEDLDWCYRVKRRKWKVLYVGSKEVLHAKGASTRQRPAAMNFHFHKAMLIFHRKHLDRHYPFFVNWLVSAGIGIRWALKSLALLFKSRDDAGGSDGGDRKVTPVSPRKD